MDAKIIGVFFCFIGVLISLATLASAIVWNASFKTIAFLALVSTFCLTVLLMLVDDMKTRR